MAENGRSSSQVLAPLRTSEPVVIAILVVLFSLKFPNYGMMLTSIIYPKNLVVVSWYYALQILAGMLLHLWIQFADWSCLVSIFAMHITYSFGAIFLLEELR